MPNVKPHRFVVLALDEGGAPRAWASSNRLRAATDEAIAQANAYLADPVREAQELRLVYVAASIQEWAAGAAADLPRRNLGVFVTRTGVRR